MLQVFLAEDPVIAYLLYGVPSRSEACLLFCNDLFSLWLESEMVFNKTLLVIRLTVL